MTGKRRFNEQQGKTLSSFLICFVGYLAHLNNNELSKHTIFALSLAGVIFVILTGTYSDIYVKLLLFIIV